MSACPASLLFFWSLSCSAAAANNSAACSRASSRFAAELAPVTLPVTKSFATAFRNELHEPSAALAEASFPFCLPVTAARYSCSALA
ncbi:MAG: hypothetical protein ACK55Z_19925, partial [bacterium]